MTDRIDHAALAAQMARDALSTSRSGAQGIAGVLAATAQVHASLALVDQQRVANLIALAGPRNPILRDQVAEDAAEALATFHEHADLALGGWHEVRPEIAAALGIKVVDHE